LTKMYLAKLLPNSENSEAKLQAFEEPALASVASGTCEVVLHGKPKRLRGFSELRKLMKLECYRCAMLAPRPSDADF
jgi:hypothetical protein